jgi:hypothetical protein
VKTSYPCDKFSYGLPPLWEGHLPRPLCTYISSKGITYATYVQDLGNSSSKVTLDINAASWCVLLGMFDMMQNAEARKGANR